MEETDKSKIIKRRKNRLKVIREITTSTLVGAFLILLILTIPKVIPKEVQNSIIKFFGYLVISWLVGNILIVYATKKKRYGLVKDC